MGSIVVIGSANIDMVVQVPHLPAAGETVLGTSFQQIAGGKGANQAVAAARAGGDVVFVGCVGDDDAGSGLIKAWETEGIQTDLVSQLPETPTGVALISVDESGENCIAVASGANAFVNEAKVLEAEDAIARCSHILLQLEIPISGVQCAINLAAQYQKYVILNPAPSLPLPPSILGNVHLLTPNHIEAIHLTDRQELEGDPETISEALLEKGPQCVMLTLGDQGAYCATQHQKYWLPPFETDVVDTTAAGDAFNGALAAALTKGATIIEAGRFASAAASISVSRQGAQPSLPKYPEIIERLSSKGHS